jgi:CBS domain containing-hemolysin-like protein
MELFVLVLLAAIALVAVSLLKTYRHVPAKELKRRAREGDDVAAVLFRAVAYGTSLETILWFLVGITFAVFFWFVSLNTPTLIAILLSAGLLWYGFVWMPAREVAGLGKWLAASLAPAFAWLLGFLHPVIETVVRFVRSHLPVSVHTGLYDREDILELLQYQSAQPDNRVVQTELEIAFHALTFGDQLVRDVMIPRRAVKMVSADETVGPVLLTELHDSGFSRFPVYADDKDTVVGILFLRDLVKAKKGGLISKVMKREVVYVHEEQSLADALQAILKTHKHMYVVVNSFEEYVGIVTIEDVIERIVGKPIIDEFDEYDDVRAVAARVAQKEHEEHVSDGKEAEPSDEPTPEDKEVVELPDDKNADK